jgi:hypothetical protein
LRARLITTVPTTEYENRVVAIQGDPKTAVGFINMAAEVPNVTILHTFTDEEVARKTAGPNRSPMTFITSLMVAWDEGRAQVEGDGDDLVKGFTAEPVRDVQNKVAEPGASSIVSVNTEVQLKRLETSIHPL